MPAAAPTGACHNPMARPHNHSKSTDIEPIGFSHLIGVPRLRTSAPRYKVSDYGDDGNSQDGVGPRASKDKLGSSTHSCHLRGW